MVSARGSARERPTCHDRDGRPDPSPDDDRRGSHLSLAPEPHEIRAERVSQARARWTSHLVELGGPNTLLWYRDLPVGTLDLTNAHLGTRGALLSGTTSHLSALVREAGHLEDARHRAQRIHDTAAELEREHAIATCFIGIGTATWTVVLPGGRVLPREPAAPVFLRSCRIVPADPRCQDWLLEPGEELEVNPALVDYLAAEHGIAVDTDRLETLATAGGALDPYPAYEELAQACGEIPDFTVRPRVVVTTFPHHKAPLVADLAAQADTLAEHEVVAALAGYPEDLSATWGPVAQEPGPAGAEPPSEPSPDHDADTGPDVLVLPTDASQREAVHAVRSGSHLLIHSPPGTGATQTVANLVAALAADGRSVLLVSPKRPSLDAARQRLSSVGLGDLVLDLPEGGHGRRRAVRDLLETLDALPPPPEPARGRSRRRPEAPAPTPHEPERSPATQVLDRHVEALHGRRDPWGASLHEVQEEVCRAARAEVPPRSRVRVTGDALAGLDRATLDDAAATTTRLARLAAWDHDVDDPWFGATLRSDAEAHEAGERVQRLAAGLVEDTRATLADVFRGVHLPAAPTVSDWHRVLVTVARVRDTLEIFRPEIFDIPLDDLVAATAGPAERRASGSELGVVDRWRVRRQARALLRPGRPPADLHAALQDAHEQRHAWRELVGAGGRPEIPVELDRARVAHATLLADLDWLDARLPDDGGPPLVTLDLHGLADRVSGLHAAGERLGPAPQIRACLDALDSVGLGEVVTDLRERRVPAEHVAAEVRWVWWCSLADEISAHDPRIAEHDGAVLTQALATLARAEAEDRRSRVAGVLEAVAARVQRVRRQYPEQEAALREQGQRPGRPEPLPEVVQAAGELMTALRPCWVASPLTVPSVLPPGRWFDVVILEEASMTSAAESVAAVSRAQSVVVVGDPEQLGPVPFVVSCGADAPEDADAESVLDALADALPTRRLARHHAALDERLVAFADAQVYGGSLLTVPGTGTTAVVRHDLVEGHGVVAEGQGAVESTTAEVDRVLELVLEHARNRADRSLVVIALSPGHRRRVETAVRQALATLGDRELSALDPYRPEGFAVRGADAVQGETWDDVILTVGFGKTPHGRVLHRFGPLGSDTGHRQLTLATTRARRSLTVVSTITADDLDPQRLRTPGPRLLRALLEHAAAASGEDGVRAAPEGQGRSEILGELARRLRGHGLVVHEEVGSASAGVGLGIEDPTRPGHLVLAVECDGPDYAATRSSHDRDVLRVDQLRARGWDHLRVWSIDVFRDPARDVSRVLEALGVRRAPGG